MVEGDVLGGSFTIKPSGGADTFMQLVTGQISGTFRHGPIFCACLVALLILASMPVKAQQQATQALTITVGSGSGAQQATQALTLTVGSSSGAQQASQALTLTVSAGGPQSAQATFPLVVLHSATLTWQAGTPGANPIAGYNVFRSTRSGGPYSQINSALVSGLTYFDPGLASGTTYYYVIATVDSKGNQSFASPEAAAVVPVP